MDAKKQSNAWGQIVAKAWADEAFKKRLLANPSAVLNENGMEVSTGIQVKVIEDTDEIVHLTLPARPSTDELSEEEIESVAGGFCGGMVCLSPAPTRTIDVTGMKVKQLGPKTGPSGPVAGPIIL